MGQCIQWCAVYHLGIFYLVHLILFPLELPDAVQQQYLAAKLPKSDTILSVIARTTLTRRAMESHMGTVHLNALMILYVCGFSTWCCTMWHPKTTYMHTYKYIYIYTILNYSVQHGYHAPPLGKYPRPTLKCPSNSLHFKCEQGSPPSNRLLPTAHDSLGQNWWRNGYNDGVDSIDIIYQINKLI